MLKKYHTKSGTAMCCSAIRGSGIAQLVKQQHCSPRRMYICTHKRVYMTIHTMSISVSQCFDKLLKFTRFRIAKTKRVRRFICYVFPDIKQSGVLYLFVIVMTVSSNDEYNYFRLVNTINKSVFFTNLPRPSAFRLTF